MLFRRKKEEVHKGDVFLARGIYLKQPRMDNGRILLNSFLRSIIVFLLAFGSLGGFLSAFSISYNYILVIVAYLVLAMYFSFLYSTSRLVHRDIGYIAFFIVFVFALVQLRMYANSGLYLIINTVLIYMQSFFDLSGITQYEVVINNDFLTVAILMIFVGVVLIILLNIWINSSMSILWSVGLTFPILLIPTYLKMVPDAFYILCLVFGYLAILVFKANGHYVTFSWNQAFRIRGFKKDKVTYTQDFTVFRQILLSVFSIALCMVILVESVFPNGIFQQQFKQNKIWDDTGDFIANYLLLGFAGLYNRYGSTGGMSGGKLGGISSVRPDYQTDLLVTFAPYSSEPIYLKGFTGGLYDSDRWIGIYEGRGDAEDDTDTQIFVEESMKVEAMSLQMASLRGENYSARGEMHIFNEGADPNYLYYPYYTLFDDYSIYNNQQSYALPQGIRMQQSAVYKYYPKQVFESSLLEQKPAQMDTDKVNSIYLDVPEKNRAVIDNEIEKIGLTRDMSVGQITDAVRDYFDAEIPYTLRPGATPRDEDFVNYFLTKNRKGFCAHFASAATLIFREMGVPARYVEGYAFSYETILASDEADGEEYSDYFDGYAQIGESTVLSVEVSDSMAHAWVEVYIDGFGWKPVEVTPGSSESFDEEDFWSAFTSMMGGVDLSGVNRNQNNMGKIDIMKFSFLIYVVVGVLAFLVILAIVRMFVRKLLRFMRCHQSDKREAVIASYADACDMMRLCSAAFDECRSHREQLQYVHQYYMELPEIDKICELLEQISFSEGSQPEEVYVYLLRFVRELPKNIRKRERFRNKLRLIKR